MTDRPLAVVTGGARRVGRAISLELARRGCDLLVTYRSSKAEAQRLQHECEAMGASCEIERLALDDLQAVRAFAQRTAAARERVDVLVHNASTYRPTPLEGLEIGELEDAQRVNALAPLLLSVGLAPVLRASELAGGGAIVAMLDIHAMGRPRRRFAAYAMSKAALHEMVLTLAVELAPEIRVNGVAPGVVAWPEKGEEAGEAAQRAYLKRVPLQREGTPRDAAGAVAFLALEAGYVTGEVLRIDGGRWLR